MARTTMSNPHRCLPQEILDHIVDLLHDHPEALRQCCLVSRSWVPRTRQHLFAEINFLTVNHFKSWKETFPDPANSPGHYAHTMRVYCDLASTGEGNWTQSFSRVERLTVGPASGVVNAPLIPFYKFSASLKSLHVVCSTISHSHILHLVRFLPLLEDLTLIGYPPISWDGLPSTLPSTSPAFTGTLEIVPLRGRVNVVRQLLDLPNGLHFRNLILTWCEEEDSRWMDDLVAGCSSTLECFDVCHSRFGQFVLAIRQACDLHISVIAIPPFIDLSKATKLRDAVFQPGSLNVEWVSKALRTITPIHQDFRRISISMHRDLNLTQPDVDVRETIGERIYGQWSDLDRLLVQFWESRLIRPEVIWAMVEKKRKVTRDSIGCLLPEITKRGIIDLVEREPSYV